MKKVLLTASALSLLAGAAAADVTVSGDARWGLAYDEGAATTTILKQRVRVHFGMSTETDGGLTFGAKVGLDTRTEDGVAKGENDSTVRRLDPIVTVSGMGFDFAAGNVNGAIVDTVGLWAGGLGWDAALGRPAGFAMNDVQNDERLNGGAIAQVAKVGYSFGDFSVAVSTAFGAEEDTEFAAKYSANGITVAIGADDDDTLAVSGSYKSGDFLVGAIYKDSNTDGEVYRLYGNYTMGATKIGVIYTDMNAADTYAIGVAHSLGGGVTLHAAAGEGLDGDMEAQLGFTMGF